MDTDMYSIPFICSGIFRLRYRKPNLICYITGETGETCPTFAKNAPVESGMQMLLLSLDLQLATAWSLRCGDNVGFKIGTRGVPSGLLALIALVIFFSNSLDLFCDPFRLSLAAKLHFELNAIHKQGNKTKVLMCTLVVVHYRNICSDVFLLVHF